VSYDTPLTPEEEAIFRQWAGKRIGDLADYDLRGAWKTDARAAQNGHLPDTFKKPNHPTFSDESQYSTPDNPGGRWDDAGNGKWLFWASQANMRGRTIGDLANYFKQVEPGNEVIFPIDYHLPPGRR